MKNIKHFSSSYIIKYFLLSSAFGNVCIKNMLKLDC